MRKRIAAQGGVLTPEKAFGAALRALRSERAISQDELGAISGYHRTYIGQLERGEKSPSLRTIFNICTALRTRPSRVLAALENNVARHTRVRS